LSEPNDSRDYAQWEKETTSELRSRILGVREKVIEVLVDMQEARCAMDLLRVLDALTQMRDHVSEINSDVNAIVASAAVMAATRVRATTG
jgi:hypothetical protein